MIEILYHLSGNDFDNIKIAEEDKEKIFSEILEIQIASLTKTQAVNLIKLILTYPDDNVIEFLLNVLDTQYSLASFHDRDNLFVERFLGDKRFYKFNKMIFGDPNLVNEPRNLDNFSILDLINYFDELFDGEVFSVEKAIKYNEEYTQKILKLQNENNL